ncbi:NADH:ubiquinone reductase (Na(+)-transporting) subunit F [Methylothermus subterraneus]
METFAFWSAELGSLWESLVELWPSAWPKIALGVGVFVALVLTLTAVIVLAKAFLVPSGIARIVVNDERILEVPVGGKLLSALASQGIYLSSACGGKGICGECRAIVLEGAGPPLPPEVDKLGRARIRQGYRLTCQVAVKNDLKMRIPEEMLGVKTWIGVVRSNRNLTPLLKEPVIDLPEPMRFKAGQYILLEAPPHSLRFRDFAIDERFRPDWDRFDWWRYESRLKRPTTRSYSLANAPQEGQIAMLNVRLALPPPDRPDIPPGAVSAYVFSLKPGEKVKISGPYGEFRVREGNSEMIFVGGGAGMAPLRSMILDELKRKGTQRKMSYWYGARSLKELFYADLFEQLAREHSNFSFQVALSEPRPEDLWEGPVGFIHQVLYERYLKDHPAPEDCQYYLCGPPPMIDAVLAMLDGLGVDLESIFFDKF